VRLFGGQHHMTDIPVAGVLYALQNFCFPWRPTFGAISGVLTGRGKRALDHTDDH
jgi:hypothetical protein